MPSFEFDLTEISADLQLLHLSATFGNSAFVAFICMVCRLTVACDDTVLFRALGSECL